MKLSVSNIAWAPEDRATAYATLRDHGATGLEIAPGLSFPDLADPFAADAADCAAFRDEAARHGLELCSMQSLLFGVEGAALFGAPPERQRFEDGLAAAIALAGRLGVPNLVMGSPKNRIIPDGMGADTARTIWRESFCRLGDLATKAGTVLALEPNPPEYGANFMTTLADTLSVARACDHDAVRVNLDLGALVLTGEIAEIEAGGLPAGADMIHHIHISTPMLKPVDAGASGIAAMWRAAEIRPVWVSIEMTGGIAGLPAALRAVQEARA